MQRIARYGAVASLLLWAGAASAATIFDAGPPSTEDDSVYLSDRDASTHTTNQTGLRLYQQIGGLFTLQPGANTITDVHWWGIYGTSGSIPQQPLQDDHFLIRFFVWDVDSVVDPFVEIGAGNAVNRTDSGLNVSVNDKPFDIFAYSVDIAPLTLVPNTRYLLSIVNDTTSSATNSWSWSQSATDAGMNLSGVRQRYGSEPEHWYWGGVTGDVAFHLTSVPAPAPAALLGIGLAALGFARRKMT